MMTAYETSVPSLPVLQRSLPQIATQLRNLAMRNGVEQFNDIMQEEEEEQVIVVKSRARNRRAMKSSITRHCTTAVVNANKPWLECTRCRQMPEDDSTYLAELHETLLINALERQREIITSQNHDITERTLQAEWENIKNGMSNIENKERKIGQSQSKLSFTKKASALSAAMSPAKQDQNNLQMHSKKTQYLQVIKRMNEYRSQQNASYGEIIEDFCDVAKAFDVDNKNPIPADTWAALSSIADEANSKEAQFFRAHQSTVDDTDKNMLSVKLAAGARRWLERSYDEYVRAQIAQRRLPLGPRPQVRDLYVAFAQAKVKAPEYQNITMSQGEPIYAVIFFLLRAGQLRDVEGVLRQHAGWWEKDSSRFPELLKKSLDPTYSRSDLSNQCANEWNALMNEDEIDPFQEAIWKLIGRCDISKRKNVKHVTNVTTEDYLWYQLSIISEDRDSVYSLKTLQYNVTKYGAEHFCAKKGNPWVYFQVLLITGQFEQAIAYLITNENYYIEAVHFSIALAYYGLLRQADEASFTGEELLSDANSPYPSFNFAEVITLYVQAFSRSNPEEALHYSILLCLEGVTGKKSPDTEKLFTIMNEIVNTSRDWSLLLGNVSDVGTIVQGKVYDFAIIAGIVEPEAFVVRLVEEAARGCQAQSDFTGAMTLHNLAQNYDAVLELLNRSLANALTAVTNPAILNNSTVQTPEQTVTTADNIIKYYQSNIAIYDKISSSKKMTCSILIRLVQFFLLVRAEQWRNALLLMEELQILPISHDAKIADIPIKASRLMRSYESYLASHVDEIILFTMRCIEKQYQTIKMNSNNESALTEYRQKAQLLLTFSAALDAHMQGDTYTSMVESHSRMK